MMSIKQRLLFGVRCITFALLLFVILLMVNRVLEPKYTTENSRWPTTSSYNQFYQMEDQTIDVLFLGSSVCVNAFSPQVMYNNYGIRSYNLGSEQQSVFLSYYWLVEALRTQSPKVVVFDTRFVFTLHGDMPLNTSEGLIRKCLDPMKWSSVKAEAVHALCEIDPSQSELSYYLTNIRFHSRWTSLTQLDLDLSLSASSPLKGFSALTEAGPASYDTYTPSDPNAMGAPQKVCGEYLIKMCELCREKGIELVLVSLPGNAMSDKANNYLQSVADNYGIDYINLCMTGNYELLNAELPKESTIHHQNIWGSEKTSDYFGRLLTEKYGVTAQNDPQWESTRENYRVTRKNSDLPFVTELPEYLRMIKDDQYTVFISVREDAAKCITQEAMDAMHELGLTANLAEMNKYSYYAVVDSELGVLEASDPAQILTLHGYCRDGRTEFIVTSGGNTAGSISKIMIDGQNYSKNRRGINIVVYDKLQGRVVDQISFDTHAEGMPGKR